MVFDSIDNASRYYGLGRGIEKALRYFEGYDAASHTNERVYLDGDDIFVNRPSYTTAPREDALMEAHRDYIDVMFVVSGEERFYTKPLERLEITSAYDPSVDACLGKIDADAATFRFPAGYFCVFFPEDAHCAGQLWETPSEVKKLIAKVRLTAL